MHPVRILHTLTLIVSLKEGGKSENPLAPTEGEGWGEGA